MYFQEGLIFRLMKGHSECFFSNILRPRSCACLIFIPNSGPSRLWLKSQQAVHCSQRSAPHPIHLGPWGSSQCWHTAKVERGVQEQSAASPDPSRLSLGAHTGNEVWNSHNLWSFFTTTHEHSAKLFQWISFESPHINPLRKISL